MIYDFITNMWLKNYTWGMIYLSRAKELEVFRLALFALVFKDENIWNTRFLIVIGVGSMIREPFKLEQDIISLVVAICQQRHSCKEIEEIAAKGLGENPVSLLQYGLSEGYTPLRDTMKKHLEKKEGLISRIMSFS
ncbi:MAG: hypothetical protein ACLS9K_10540 [Lachnospira eligens]